MFVKLSQGARREVLGTDAVELETSRMHIGLRVCDTEENDFVTSTLQTVRQRESGVEVTSARKTKDPKSRHRPLWSC